MAIISPDEDGIVGDRRGRKPKRNISLNLDVIKYSNDFTYEDFEHAMYFKSGCRSKEIHARLHMSDYCYNLYQFINESNIIKYSKGESTLSQSFIVIGAISLCVKNNIVIEQTKNIIKVLRGRGKPMDSVNKVTEQLNSLSKYIDIKKSNEVLDILSQYSESSAVANAYYDLYKIKPDCSPGVSGFMKDLTDMCRDLLKTELTINAFYVKKNIKNINKSITIQGEIAYLINNLKLIYNKKITAAIVRMCFIVGMRIFANLINNKLIKINHKLECSAINELYGMEIKYMT